MAKERPVPSGDRNPATARDRQAAPAGPQHPPRETGPRRPVAAGPSDPRPIPAPFMQNIPPALPPSLALYPHLRGAPLQGPSTRDRAMARRRRRPGPVEPPMRETEVHPTGATWSGEAQDRPVPAPHPYLSESASDFAAAEPFAVPTAGSGPASLSGPIGGADLTFTPGPAAEVTLTPGPATEQNYTPGSAAEVAFPGPAAEQNYIPGPAAERTFAPGPAAEQTSNGPAHRAEDAYDPDKTRDFGLVDNAVQPTVAVPAQSTGRTSAASVLAGAAAARPRKTPVGQQRTNRPGNQRFSNPPAERDRHQRGTAGASRRSEPARVAVPRPVLPGLQLQPMVHVTDMAAAVAFYEMLGGEINHGDRDGDWVLMQVGVSQIGLVSRPPDAEHGENTVELNFSATMPLDRLEHLLRAHGIEIVRLAADPDLGVQLHVETPDGMPIKIHQVEPDLLV